MLNHPADTTLRCVVQVLKVSGRCDRFTLGWFLETYTLNLVLNMAYICFHCRFIPFWKNEWHALTRGSTFLKIFSWQAQCWKTQKRLRRQMSPKWRKYLNTYETARWRNLYTGNGGNGRRGSFQFRFVTLWHHLLLTDSRLRDGNIPSLPTSLLRTRICESPNLSRMQIVFLQVL